MGLQIDTLPAEPEQFNVYLSALNDEQLARLSTELEGRFDEVHASIKEGTAQDVPGSMSLLKTLGAQFRAAKADKARRDQEALDAEADEATARQNEVLEKLRASVKTAATPPTSEPSPVSGDDVQGGDGAEFPQQFARQLLEAVAMVSATVQNVKGPDLNKHIRDLPLAAAAGYAPDPKVAPRRSEPTLVATADIPGVTNNSRIPTFEGLVQHMHSRARMLQPTRLGRQANFVPVATLERDFRYRLALDSTPEEIDEVLTAATDVAALVAAGGWCSPSEISYDFYNIVAEDGLIDLPSVGVLNRGGIRFPVSPSIASIFSTEALWTWTEDVDEAAVDSDSELKTCARIDCPEFTDVRTHCDGLCVTVGNLVDFSYPELVANHIRLVFAARAHVTNRDIIAGLAAHALTDAVNLSGVALGGAAASILSGTEMQVEDIRSRFRMAQGSILEAVYPHWALGLFRADLANRTGVDLLSVTNGQIADWLNQRGVRAQFVYDWQSGFATNAFGQPSTEATAWPATMQFLLYPAGTFVRGQGLQLDLGVVRDSVLNERNDHTGAWMEDCYAIAGVGHEARLVTVATDTCGLTADCGS